MIVDHIENLEKVLPYIKANENIVRALNYLKETDMTALPLGKNIVDGDIIFINVNSYQTKPKAEARPETHAKYIDIQYMIEGEETIGYSRCWPGLTVTEDKLLEKDIIFYNNVREEIDIPMKPGTFAIFFPWDVHRPSCTWQTQTQVKKAIVKVKAI